MARVRDAFLPKTPPVVGTTPPPPGAEKVAREVARGRRDLRSLPVMSIDPPGCRDIDDALHWRALPGGTWEVRAPTHTAWPLFFSLSFASCFFFFGTRL